MSVLPQILRSCGLFGVAIATCLLVIEPAVAQRSGDDRRGGDSGGGRGGERGGFRGRGGGGPPGGFDPTFILRRMDRNGNGRLDPDEIDGRARFMIERFAPGVDTSKPISIDEMRKKIQEAREQRDRERRSGRGGDRRRGEPEKVEIEPLVPGFGEEIVLDPVPGFGGSGEFFAVVTSAADEAEAERTIGRYDRNRNGKLDREEVRQGRWYDDPTVYDQNGDGALTKRELAVRYAKRRITKEEERENDRRDRNRRDNDRDRRDRAREQKNEDNEDERKSYRFLTAHERLPAGIPDWFRQKDLDLDGQVGMSEYSELWDDETVAAFVAIDANGDGMLSAAEALEQGAEAASGTNASTDGGGNEGKDAKEIPDKYLNYAHKQVKKYDKNGDAVLSQEEVAAMRLPPKNADLNGDDKITAEEFARSIMR